MALGFETVGQRVLLVEVELEFCCSVPLHKDVVGEIDRSLVISFLFSLHPFSFITAHNRQRPISFICQYAWMIQFTTDPLSLEFFQAKIIRNFFE